MIVTLEMVKAAQKRLEGVAQRTQLLPAALLGEQLGCDVTLKMENLQKTGSFKLRGAYNKVATLSDEERSRGIVASSAGNHAQGVALAAAEYGVPATICMPGSAPLSKIEATKRYGAKVELAGKFYDDAYEKAQELQEKNGMTFCHPFNDPQVIAGQGTIALEILEDAPDTDVIIVPIGGGGLISGIAIAAKAINPSIRIIGVQTANMPSMKLSVDNDCLTTVDSSKSLADGITVAVPGNLTFSIVREYVDEIVTVTESEIASGILFLLERVKTAAEGAGACPVAALLAGKIKNIAGRKVVALVSGGNIDVNRLGEIINTGLVQSWRKVYLDLLVEDRPHVLSELTGIISSTNANILSIFQNRGQRDLQIGYVHVCMEVETSDKLHADRLVEKLKRSGYPVSRFG